MIVSNTVRQPAVAGQFYPGSAEELKEQIANFLDQAENSQTNKKVKALIVPHAGYSFSGPVAAEAYNQIKGEERGTVIVICNSHSAFFEGVALSEADYWSTPLGRLEVDKEKSQKLSESNEHIDFYEKAHAGEHSLEVQIPFLQTVLQSGFKVLPVLFGNISGEDAKQLAGNLADILKEKDLIVVSSDMSHFPPYEEANRIDTKTLEIIAEKDTEELENHISEVMEQGIPGEETLLCGEDGVKTIMEMANSLDWEKGKILKYANSGDTGLASKDSVVGYGAMVFNHGEKKEEKGGQAQQKIDNQKESQEELNSQEQEILLKVARETVESYVKDGKIPEFNIKEEKLQEPRGAFVTLKKGDQLRGCIGQIVQSEKPLWEVVEKMAIAAAVKDHRFSPVTPEELPDLTYEISVLSLPEPVNDWRNIEPGKHGVIVRKGGYSGVFLPQVAEETGWNKEEFLSQLCWQKAGLQPDSFKTDKDLEMYTFTSEVFSN